MKKYIAIAMNNSGTISAPAIMTDPGQRSTGPFNKVVQVFGVNDSGDPIPLRLSSTGELWS